MLATIVSAALQGIDAEVVHVEVNAGEVGEPKLFLVGSNCRKPIIRISYFAPIPVEKMGILPAKTAWTDVEDVVVQGWRRVR